MTKFPHQPFPFAQKSVTHSLRAVSRLSEKLRGGAVDSCKSSLCQPQSSAHCMAPSAGAKFYEGWLHPVASISALKWSRSVDPQRGWARLNAPYKCEQHDQPRCSDFCRVMPMIGGEQTFWLLHHRSTGLTCFTRALHATAQCFWNEGTPRLAPA